MSSSVAASRFTGTVALVAGGAHGIGRACAERLAAEGARVVVADLDLPVAGEVAAGLPRATAVELDVTSTASVTAAVERTVAEHGRLHALVCVAGGDTTGTDFTDPDEAWLRMLDLNLLGVVRLCRAAVPELRRSGGGSVVAISSVNALRALGGDAYSAAKAGLGSLVVGLGARLGADGIRVNAVAPGTVRTRVWDSQGGPDRLAPLYPLGRVGEPADIAAAVAFLASPDAAWITGQVVPVDGGLLTGRWSGNS